MELMKEQKTNPGLLLTCIYCKPITLHFFVSAFILAARSLSNGELEPIMYIICTARLP